MHLERCERIVSVAREHYPRIAGAIAKATPTMAELVIRGGSLGILDRADVGVQHPARTPMFFGQLSINPRHVVPHAVADLAKAELAYLGSHPELRTSRKPEARPHAFAAAVRGSERIIAFAGRAWTEEEAEFVVLAVMVAAGELDLVLAIRFARMGKNEFGRELENVVG